jgi:hypothetical protein
MAFAQTSQREVLLFLLRAPIPGCDLSVQLRPRLNAIPRAGATPETTGIVLDAATLARSVIQLARWIQRE